jgi:hypothetical protein
MDSKEPYWRRRIAGQRGSERKRVEEGAPAPSGDGPYHKQADQSEPCSPMEADKRQTAGGFWCIAAAHCRTETTGAAIVSEAPGVSSRRQG